MGLQIGVPYVDIILNILLNFPAEFGGGAFSLFMLIVHCCYSLALYFSPLFPHRFYLIITAEFERVAYKRDDDANIWTGVTVSLPFVCYSRTLKIVGTKVEYDGGRNLSLFAVDGQKAK